jgi:hypothetical protein
VAARKVLNDGGITEMDTVEVGEGGKGVEDNNIVYA